MLEARVVLEILTPMFMRGAEEVELRSASFKGVLRWWWRAVRSDGDTERLHREEASVFGYADAGASKVALEVENISPSSSHVSYDRSQRLYRWNVGGRPLTWTSKSGRYYGLAYLLYPFLMLGVRNGGKTLRHLGPGQSFTLTLRSRYGEPLKQALASLWCAVWLGGFGARSRRGGGNLSFVSVELPEGFNLGLDFRFEGGDFLNWLKDNFQRCREIIGWPKNFTDKYSNLALARVVVSGENFKTWYDALNAVGRIFYNFRRKANRRKNFVFGLPHKYAPDCRSEEDKEKSKKYERRASPVIIKVVRVRGGYRWLVLRLQGQFLPNCPKIDYRPIDDFWRELKNRGGRELLLGTPELLDRYVESLRREGAKRIVLFGSKARGDFTERSDTDLYVEPAKYYEAVGNLDVVARPNEALRSAIEWEGVEIWRSDT